MAPRIWVSSTMCRSADSRAGASRHLGGGQMLDPWKSSITGSTMDEPAKARSAEGRVGPQHRELFADQVRADRIPVLVVQCAAEPFAQYLQRSPVARAVGARVRQSEQQFP